MRLLLALWMLACAGPLAAAESCPAGNLLAGKKPLLLEAQEIALVLPTDGVIAEEGASRSSRPLALTLPDSSTRLIFDLGGTTTVRSVYLQAGSGHRYQVLVSSDGRSFQPLLELPAIKRAGWRSRAVRAAEERTARFIALAPIGRGPFEVTEVAAFCRDPQSLMKEFRVASRPVWNDTTSLRWALVLALLGILLLVRRVTGEPGSGRGRDHLLALGGILAALTYFNFGSFHFGQYIHTWDMSHYYLGSKYFRELGYTRLYDCMEIADAEDRPDLVAPNQRLRDLRTNSIVTAEDILAHPERCTSRFATERWMSFKRDVAFFRGRVSRHLWMMMRTDHGFNGTPVWLLAGEPLSANTSATNRDVIALSLLDPAYMIAICAVIAWAFGWRVLCIALLVLSTYFPARFHWTGGSFLRWDWAFYTVAAICCLRKGKPLLGGAALGYATLLRLFPVALFAGPVLLAIRIWLTERRLDRDCLRFCLGGVLAAVILIPLSAARVGIGAYPAFIQKITLHDVTPASNKTGLRTALAYRPKETMRRLPPDYRLLDPWQRWEKAKEAAYRKSELWYAALVIVFLGLFWRALGRAAPWSSAALAAILIAVLFEATGYYGAYLLALSLLAAHRERYGLWLLALAAASCTIAWLRLPDDASDAWISVALVAVFAGLLWDFGRRKEVAGSSQAGSRA